MLVRVMTQTATNGYTLNTISRTEYTIVMQNQYEFTPRLVDSSSTMY